MANEKRLIDANALKDALRTNDGAKALGHSIYKLFAVDEIIDQMPTVDAVEVVHGRWIVDKDRLCATCSECGKTLNFSDEMQIALLWGNERFCYYCGAKMDGKRIAASHSNPKMQNVSALTLAGRQRTK